MNQEKFVNQYIEILNVTVTEAIQKNLVFQAQKKIIESELEETKKALEAITVEKNREIENLKNQLNSSRKETAVIGNEREELKKSIQHVDVFKKQLVEARSEIEKLLAENAQKDKTIDAMGQRIKAFEQETLNNIVNENKPKDAGNTWVKKVPAKKKVVKENKEEIVKDAGKF